MLPLLCYFHFLKQAMNVLIYPVSIRWADIDANFHLRHSVYYDWAATCRLEFLSTHGLTMELMQKLKMGPVIFREECVFRREIKMGDTVTISMEILASKKDYSRWSIRHAIMKDPKTVAAILTIDGAWLDIANRKLAIPSAEIVHVFSQMPQGSDFKWID